MGRRCFTSFYILRASTTINSTSTFTMIATIATVCLAVSAAAEPLRTPLLRNFYSTGSSCSLSNYQCVDGNSFCEDGNVMTCASGTVCGTPERPDWTPCIPPGPSPTPTPPHPGCSMDGNTCGRMGHPMCCLRKLSNNLRGLASHEAQRKLTGYTTSLRGLQSGSYSASAVDVAKAWMEVNGKDLEQCNYAMAIALGEGNLETANIADPGQWAPGWGPGKKGSFLKTTRGGPWQLTSYPEANDACSSGPNWLQCWARYAKQYATGKGMPANNPGYGSGVFPHHWSVPVTWIFPDGAGSWCGCPHSNHGGQTIRWSGRCETGHARNYYSAWLPNARAACHSAYIF